MGLFDNSSSKSDEVRIGISEKENDSKLKNEVETRIADRETESSSEGFSSGSVSIEDVHEQNERIIELLENIAAEDKGGMDAESISNRRKSSRNSERNDDNEGMRGGMDELL